MTLKKLAWFFSIILHPLLLPTLTFFLLLYVSPNTTIPIHQEARYAVIMIVFILTFMFPMLWIYLLYLTNVIKDIRMRSKEERIIPFIITSVCYIIVTFMFLFMEKFRILPMLAVITGCVSLSIFLVTVITLFWKISAHSVGIAGVVGFILGFAIKYGNEGLLYPFLISVVLAGILMSSRLHLNAHTSMQVLAGTGLGFIICLGGILLFL